MKRPSHRFLLGAAVLAFAIAGLQSASAQIKTETDKPSKKPKAALNAKAKSVKRQKVYVTGSRIPHKVDKAGNVVGCEVNIGVIAEKQLRDTGSGKVAEALRKNPRGR